MAEGQQGDGNGTKRPGFAKSLLTLGSGAVLAQLIGIAASPVVTRLFTPEAFGLAAVVGTVFVILAPVAGGKYDAAIPLPREDPRAASLLGLSLALVLVTTAIVGIAMIPLGGPLLAAMDAEALGPHVWLLPLGVALFGCGFPLRAWFVRHGRFRDLAGVEVAHTAGNALGSIAAGAVGLVSGLDLVAVRLASQSLVPLWLGLRMGRLDRGAVTPHWRRDAVAPLARRYADFPRFTVWVDLMNAASRGLPTVLLAGAFGAGTAGLFALANRVILLPSQVVARSTSQVLLQRVAVMRAHDEPIGRLLEQIVTRLAMVGLLPATVLAAAGPDLFAWAFGAEWLQAGRYAAALSPWILTLIVASPLSVLWAVFERQRVALPFNVALLSARVATLVLGPRTWADPALTLLAFGLVGIAFNLVLVAYFGRLGGVRFARILRGLSAWVGVAALCASVPLGLRLGVSASVEWIVAGVVAQAVLYGLAVLAFDAELRGVVRGLLRRD